MSLARWRYDFKLLGRVAFLTPPLMMVGFALIALLLHMLGIAPARFLSSSLEMFLPTVMGFIVATTTLHDPALELQLTLPRSYATTTLRRLIFLVGWSACMALLASTLIALFHQSYAPQQIQSWPPLFQAFGLQMVWFVPLVWFVTAGLCVALLTHSRTASGALLACFWIIETLFLGNLIAKNPWLQPLVLFPTTLAPGASFWLSSRLTLLLIALLLLPINWLLLSNREALLKGMSEE